ncbi:hypothetical protein SAMN05444369_108109 [Capnocytophaga haemolytica]|jgi:hypothetical protein|uniref:Uncharacterized protein n=1 Tax=Capnocytophaga haemolytica TaxID=45243 RepID=A0AAX2H1D4_9FLAO|nr:hypothetical protein [Capnocytophaga haemolytica]AMD84141.1 hypothetical protein AXF12_00455 [Capnocytophaga haemolytica]SFO07697.1 hypothetical protein SAMN05444369_108109 [Capnocytophaga haemolytica]SNV13147.1 Uncharacterised protein [Capnocytophaga haemolytica]
MRNRVQESTAAIERMYVTMRHLFSRGFYKPMGVSGETLRESLLVLRPEIYGTIAESKVELSGLTYVLERLPEGIEQCKFINLIADEGYRKSHFKPIIPPKRRRNCYRIDDQQMNIEITRGRSDIYDVLTHLTFLFIESHKIAQHILLDENKISHDWEKVEWAVSKGKLTQAEREATFIHIGNILGRTFEEILEVHKSFATTSQPDRFIHIIYWLGKRALNELLNDDKRTITFSTVLRERLGHHVHGEIWAENIKRLLYSKGLLQRPLHIISANMHSVMNSLFAEKALHNEVEVTSRIELFELLSKSENEALRKKVKDYAQKNGMVSLDDTSGTNIDIQIFDTAKIDFSNTPYQIKTIKGQEPPVIIVMDYAFGEQAYETIDELLKPFHREGKTYFLDVLSISIMGKAGILEGEKGDLMIPTAHIFEGTADNYPFKNEFSKKDFEGNGLKVFEGSMITVLGTSLQNKDILKFFLHSTWNAIGLEMEGVHYQKAIQSASKVRKSIREDVKVRYAYYASDNPLETGSTLASGGLGTTGVKPTYLITFKILEQIFS